MPKHNSRGRRKDKRNTHHRRSLRKVERQQMRDAINRGLEYGRGMTYWHHTKAEIISGGWSQSSRYQKKKDGE